MRVVAAMAVAALMLPMAACTPADPEAGPLAPVQYGGVRTALLADDLVQFLVETRGGRGAAEVQAYADCAAAQYTLIRGYGFVRHIRTNLQNSGGERGGIWRADAVYTVSPDLPSGHLTIDAESRVRDCRDRGIPTV